MEKLALKKKNFPKTIQQDIEKIKTVLLRHGAPKIILYGSMVRGDYNDDSDIDICFEGVPDEKYFRVLAECLMETDRPVSVFDFNDIQGYFRKRILKEGKILYKNK
jgi:predicted nucleotidyltransferase